LLVGRATWPVGRHDDGATVPVHCDVRGLVINGVRIDELID
jgi:hypothetical protein